MLKKVKFRTFFRVLLFYVRTLLYICNKLRLSIGTKILNKKKNRTQKRRKMNAYKKNAMDAKVFKTDCQVQREKRDLAIYKEYMELMSAPGQSSTLVTQHLMKKYHVHSPGTIYVIRRRVEESLNRKEAVS